LFGEERIDSSAADLMECMWSSDLYWSWSTPSMIERLEFIEGQTVWVYFVIILCVVDMHLVWIDPDYGTFWLSNFEVQLY